MFCYNDFFAMSNILTEFVHLFVIYCLNQDSPDLKIIKLLRSHL